MGRVVDTVLDRDGIVLITADHGNCERMIVPETGKPHTAHTTNKVEFIMAVNNARKFKLKQKGKLSDITVTMLDLLKLPIPPEMTANTLIEKVS